LDVSAVEAAKRELEEFNSKNSGRTEAQANGINDKMTDKNQAGGWEPGRQDLSLWGEGGCL